MGTYSTVGVTELIGDLQNYCQKHIVTEYFNSDIVADGKYLNKAVAKLKSKTMCQSHIKTAELCVLDYWDEMVRLICSRISSINKDMKTSTSCCETYNTIRFLNTGLPVIIYPSKTTTIVQQLTLIFLFISGIVQFIRVQIDGGLSFWAQVIYCVGCIGSLAYYASIKSITMVIPQFGALLLALVTLWGLVRNVEQPWASL